MSACSCASWRLRRAHVQLAAAARRLGDHQRATADGTPDHLYFEDVTMAAVVRLVAPASVWHGMHVPNVGQECVLRRSTSLMSSRTARRCCKETKRSPIGSCGADLLTISMKTRDATCCSSSPRRMKLTALLGQVPPRHLTGRHSRGSYDCPARTPVWRSKESWPRGQVAGRSRRSWCSSRRG